MEQIILAVHLVIALAIIGLIMLQQGKGADMGASFGAGASQTLFGSQGGGNVLTKSTAILATLFFATSFGLAIVAKDKAVNAGVVEMPIPAVIETENMPSAIDEMPASVDDMPPSEAAGNDIPAAQ
jgi:preprotein translocase subunit SecG